MVVSWCKRGNLKQVPFLFHSLLLSFGVRLCLQVFVCNVALNIVVITIYSYFKFKQSNNTS